MRLKKIGISLISIIMILSLFGCGTQSTQPSNNNSNKSNEEKQKEGNKETNDKKKETKITSGELFDKINAVEPAKEIMIIEDTEIGFKNVNISINVSKGTAVEELEAYTKKVAKIQTSLSEYFLSNKYLYITYGMYVENEMKSVFTSYKKQDNKYNLEKPTIIDEKYKKAANVLN